MDMIKRMKKEKINTNEIPRLGMDIGGVTVKIAFFESDATADDDQMKLKKFLDENYKAYLVNENVNNEMKIKNVTGNVHLYLFTRDYFNEKFLNQFINLKLNEPFICLTGAALVNYMNVLIERLKSRIIMLSSENEAFIRGIKLLQAQTISSFQKIEESSNIIYRTELLNDFYPSIIAIIGTGTTYLRLNSPDCYTFLQQSAISGQTFMGLVNTANRISGKTSANLSFDECVQQSLNGKNEKLDVTVKKLCDGNDKKVEQFLYFHNSETGFYASGQDEYIKRFGNLSISCFGDYSEKSINLDDFSSASMNLVCYQIAENLNLYSKFYPNNKHILCTGSFLINNVQAKLLINKYFHILNRKHSKNIYFIHNEASLGAIGCLAVDENNCIVNAEDDLF
jgi:pantothenate kinase